MFHANRKLVPLLVASLAIPVVSFAQPASTRPAAVSLTVEGEAKPISRDLLGVFFEDLNYAADGGLYAQLVQNRSFEYRATEQAGWTPMTAWELVKRGGGQGGVGIGESISIPSE